MFTYLAIAFVVLLISGVLYGFGIVMRRPPTEKELQSETCVLCRGKFDRNQLVEREVGDYKLFYFCNECIEKLYTDSTKRDGSAMKQAVK